MVTQKCIKYNYTNDVASRRTGNNLVMPKPALIGYCT